MDFEKYYENIGTKIKKMAQIIGIVVSVIFIITGFIVEFVFEFEFCGLFILGGIVTAFINYLYSWFLYAFGQITDDIQDIRISVKNEKNENSTLVTSKQHTDYSFSESANTKTDDSKQDLWVCKECGEKNNNLYCKDCGKYKYK